MSACRLDRKIVHSWLLHENSMHFTEHPPSRFVGVDYAQAAGVQTKSAVSSTRLFFFDGVVNPFHVSSNSYQQGTAQPGAPFSSSTTAHCMHQTEINFIGIYAKTETSHLERWYF